MNYFFVTQQLPQLNPDIHPNFASPAEQLLALVVHVVVLVVILLVVWWVIEYMWNAKWAQELVVKQPKESVEVSAREPTLAELLKVDERARELEAERLAIEEMRDRGLLVRDPSNVLEHSKRKRRK
jgi:hypothetical protein